MIMKSDTAFIITLSSLFELYRQRHLQSRVAKSFRFLVYCPAPSLLRTPRIMHNIMQT